MAHRAETTVIIICKSYRNTQQVENNAFTLNNTKQFANNKANEKYLAISVATDAESRLEIDEESMFSCIVTASLSVRSLTHSYLEFAGYFVLFN